MNFILHNLCGRIYKSTDSIYYRNKMIHEIKSDLIKFEIENKININLMKSDK